MRVPDDMARPPKAAPRGTGGHRWRVVVIVIAVVLVVAALSMRALAGFYTDYLWFGEAGASEVWRRQLSTKVGLSVVFTLAFFLLLWVNLAIVDRVAPQQRLLGPNDEVLLRYDELVSPRRRLVRFIVTLLFALVAGVGASSQWQSWTLFQSGGSFGTRDPLNGRDIGFYVFKLPFLTYAVSWLFASLLVVLLVVVVSDYLTGSIRVQGQGSHVAPRVKAHLSVLLALLALTKAGDYWLQRFTLTLSNRGVVQGATYTDVNAQLPAYGLLILISIFCAALFIFNIRQQGWALPVVAVSLWVLVALVAGTIYPWFIQSFQVSRKEFAREAPYIERNIVATRAALGLDKVKETDFDYTSSPDPAGITANAETINDIRLLDAAVVQRTFRTLEAQYNYFQFPDLDVDRYEIDGRPTQVVIAARELNPAGIPQQTWESQHLIYTHGYGLALAPANVVTDKGRPQFLIGGVPSVVAPSVAADFPVERPELYYGEGLDGPDGTGYAIVGTKRKEQSGGAESRYSGSGGVPIKGLMRRAAFALRFGDLEVLTSDYLTSKSKILYDRDVRERVRRVAPFLALDSDPYPVILDGRIQYVVDGYTTSNSYPYAETADTSQLGASADLSGRTFNYVRNSVKATVDAYDGTVKLYLVDDLYGRRDPVVRAWADAYPGLLRPARDMPAGLRSHFRYPEDMFRVQTAMWGRYHISKAEEFYDASDRWDVAQDPGTDLTGNASSIDGSGAARRPRVAPYYLQMRVPGTDRMSFLLMRTFVPHSEDDSKQELTSFVVADSDPDHFGALTNYTITTDEGSRSSQQAGGVDGPLIVNDNIISETKNNTSQIFTLLDAGGSKVDLGNLLIIPIDRTLLYVRPVYVRGRNENSVPELRKVVVVNGQHVEVGDTLGEALSKIFPGADITTQEGVSDGVDAEQPGPPPKSESPKEPSADDPGALLSEALSLFDEADQALKRGGASNLAEYQSKTAKAEQLVRQATDAIAAGG